jgi:hypothetical protein
MNMDNKWSIQISKEIRDSLKQFCIQHGYKMNRFVEIAILTHISGSIKK